MPYIEVWVEPVDVGPCAECEAHEDKKEQYDTQTIEILIEWIRARDMDDYANFDEFIKRELPGEYDNAMYSNRLDGIIRRGAI